MAISKTLVWRGMTIPDAYIRIDRIIGGKREGRVTPEMPGVAVWYGTVGVYANPEQLVPIYVLDVSIPLDLENLPFSELYTELKLLPEFAGAIDC